MTYNWYDTRASTWYEGYGPGAGSTHSNTGSFVDLSTLTEGTADYDAALTSVTNNILGLFEDKGITASQAQQSQQFKDLIAKAEAGDTKGAFQGAAAAVTSAEDRKDLWGADVSEGGDINRGKSFFKIDPTTGKSTVSDNTTIADLYTQGFGDEVGEIDAEGLQYWTDRLAGTGGHGEAMTIQEIAQSFAESEEANIRDAYHDQYGRDVDDAGLDYWMNVSGRMDATQTDANAYDASQLVRDSLAERDTKYEAHETTYRDEFRDALGQSSRTEDRASSPFFNAAEYSDLMNYMTNNKSVAENITDINMRMTGRDAYSQGDQDDYMAGTDLDGDGVISSDELTNDPTYMSRFGTKAEVRNLIDEFKAGGGQFNIDGQLTPEQEIDGHPGMQDFLEFGFKKVMGDKWDALTHERTKTLDDLVGILPHGKLIPEHAERLLAKENLEGTWKKKSSLWRPTGTMPGDGTDGGGISPDDWRPTPTTPDLPTPLPVDRKDINYMPNVSSDVQDTSGYGAAKTQFDQAVTAAAPDIRTAQGQAGQRFTGTSAKGVRMKRSKASRMGTIRGTKQLGREQQTKSLNI